MNDNVIMMLCYLPAPITFIIVGLMLWRFPPSYGDMFGYKTKLSYSSHEAWDFAQVFFGKLCTMAHIPVLALTLAAGVVQIVKNVDEDTAFVVFLVITFLQLIPLFTCIFITESRLKKYFGGKGE